MNTVDARGLTCPMPVAMVRKEIKTIAPDELEVLVDDRCAVENITRFGSNNGYTVSCERNGEQFRLVLKK